MAKNQEVVSNGKRVMEQNDPISWSGTKMDTEVKGQEGQTPQGSKASAKKESNRIGKEGGSTDMPMSEPSDHKDLRGDTTPSKGKIKVSVPLVKNTSKETGKSVPSLTKSSALRGRGMNGWKSSEPDIKDRRGE